MENTRQDIQKYADELFQIFWIESKQFSTLSAEDRQRVIDDYNDLYDHYLCIEGP